MRAQARPRTTLQLTGLTLRAVPNGVHGAMPTGARLRCWTTLMDHAVDVDAPEVQALAGVLATAFDAHGVGWLPITGLDAAATRHLLARWFPGADAVLALDWTSLMQAHRVEPRRDEIDDLVALLTDEPVPAATRQETRWVAHALSQASLGDDHLWQDLHLPSRRELSALMNRWFPVRAARNDRDMKWKKFLYKQLCDRAELSICRAPSCGVCSDYARCYGPEDAAAPVYASGAIVTLTSAGGAK
jgi:nitrogen fixation protein NifQ